MCARETCENQDLVWVRFTDQPLVSELAKGISVRSQKLPEPILRSHGVLNNAHKKNNVRCARTYVLSPPPLPAVRPPIFVKPRSFDFANRSEEVDESPLLHNVCSLGTLHLLRNKRGQLLVVRDPLRSGLRLRTRAHQLSKKNVHLDLGIMHLVL